MRISAVRGTGASAGRCFPAATPNDGYFTGGLQSNLTRINVHRAWDVTTGDSNLVVAVIDTGILPHPDLAGRTLPGHDFVTDVYFANDGGGRDASAADPGDWVSWSDVQDPSSPFGSACLYGGIYDTISSWHGTHMAGIIGAVANNSSGIAGINWNSKILPVRALGKCGGFDSDIIDGMRWAAGLPVPGVLLNSNPAKVLNLSLGGPGSCHAAWQAAINEITAQNKVVVAAAGNEGVDFTGTTPASCQSVVTVAAFAVQAPGTFFESIGRSFYSNFATGPAPNLFAAPGDRIYSTSDGGYQAPLNDGAFYSEYGTSGAAAHVSGIVSLMLSANPSLTQPQVLQLLRDASVPLGTWAGSGKIDALQAVGNAKAFHGSGSVPVSIVINGPSEVFENSGGTDYTASVTWSDATVTQAYPRWSMTAAFEPQATIGDAGTLPEFSVNADQSATIHASFTANGVTVNADKVVLVKDNYVVSIAASGPDTVYLNNPAPTKFSATATWRDGRVLGGDVTWSVVSGAGNISAAGLFFGTGAGSATVRATFGSLTADASTVVIADTPTPGAIVANCTGESMSGLVLDQLKSLDVGSTTDIVPLCDGKVMLADRGAKRVDVVDVVAGTIVRSWNVASPTLPSALINRMELAAGSSKVFISFFGPGSGLASIDLATPNAVPQYMALPAGYGSNYIGSLANGDDGQIWVLHSQFDMFLDQVKLSRFQVADGVPIATHDLASGSAQYMQYSKQSRILVTAYAGSGGSRRSYAVVAGTPYTFTQRESLFDAGGVLKALSPDGTRLLLNGQDLDVSAMTFNNGTWAGAGAGGFSPEGKRLAANSINSPSNDLVVYSTERHLALRTYPGANCSSPSYVATRFSPSGAYVYGYMLCGFSQDYGRLVWVALGDRPTPNAITFDAQTGLSPGALATSNSVVVDGFSSSAPISIAGGEYSVGGAAFTALAGTIAAGQSLVVRTNAPAGAYATASATVQVGAIQAQFFVTTGQALPAQWWSTAGCATEADLGGAALSLADMDPAWDIAALCDGRLLVGNRKLNRVELFDVRAGSAVKAWPLEAAPDALRLVPGTSQLLVVTNSSRVANVNLDSGVTNYIRVGGRVFDAAPTEPGEMVAVKQSFPSNNTIEGDTMNFHDIATGAQLASNFLGASVRATHVRYDSTGKLIYTGDQYHSPGGLSKFAYTPMTHAIGSPQTSLDAGDYGQDFALSPDRTRIAYPSLGGIPDVSDLAAASLQPAGRWKSGPFPRAADFRADGAKLLIGSEVSGFNRSGIQIFDVATRALEKHWVLDHCDTQQGKTRRVRLSPTGKYAYALETCGSFDGTSARLFWVPTTTASTMPQPNPVAFSPKSGVALNADVTSNEITVTGLQGQQVPVSVAGGQYSVFGGAFRTAFNGTVKDGDRIVLHQTAWFATGVTTTVTLNIAGVLIDFNVTTGASTGADTTPDPFRLYVLKRQALDTKFTSNTVVITGIDAAAPISVAGGRYSVNGGAYTTTAGSVVNGDSVTVKMTSANAINTTSSAILTVGGFSSSLTVSTASVDTTPDSFAFAPRYRIPRNAWIESVPVLIAGLGGTTSIGVAGGEYRIGGGAYTAAPGSINSGETITVRVMSGAGSKVTTSATLSIGPRSADFSATTAGPRADFGADGSSDVWWRNGATGENYIYPMSGTTILAGEGYVRTVADTNWKIAGIGDFDGDGKSDVLWRNSSTGENYLYPMNGLAIKASERYLRTAADLDWHVAGVGDFDGDGRSDIVWRNAATGENYVYLMNGASIAAEGYLRTVSDLGWNIAGIGDLNGDGKADIVWRHATSGENYVYPMEGVAIAAGEGYLRTVADLSWQIAACGDFDGDGKSDLLWRNSATGENYLYPMDGTTIKAGEGFIRTV